MTALTQGVHHVGLTVPDIQATRNFFVEGLGFTEVGSKPDYPAVFVADGITMITIWQAEDPNTAVTFDRRCNVGLHHLALSVNLEVGLDEIGIRLAAREDTTIEFAPEPLGNGGTRHMMCNIPGGVRLELVAS